MRSCRQRSARMAVSSATWGQVRHHLSAPCHFLPLEAHHDTTEKNNSIKGLTGLNLSEGSVALRLQVANVCRRFPQLLVSLAENRLSLTVAGKLAPHLCEDNIEKLLSDCVGMTKREADEYLVELRPKPLFNPSIRKRPSSESEKARPERQQETSQSSAQTSPSCPAPSVESPPSPPPSSSSNLLEPARADLFNFRFAADRDLSLNGSGFLECRAVGNHQRPTYH